MDPGELASLAQAWIHGRRTVMPKRLHAPGPSGPALQQILLAAAAAPDHGRLLPWRFVVIPASQRERLARAFMQARVERDPLATAEELAAAGEKARRSPVLVAAIARLEDGPEGIPDVERLVSLGCAIQNMLLMAQALGFHTALSSGRSMNAGAVRDLLALQPSERAACFISIGTAAEQPRPRQRPEVHEFVSVLGDGHETGCAAQEVATCARSVEPPCHANRKLPSDQQ